MESSTSATAEDIQSLKKVFLSPSSHKNITKLPSLYSPDLSNLADVSKLEYCFSSNQFSIVGPGGPNTIDDTFHEEKVSSSLSSLIDCSEDEIHFLKEDY
eukprot:jgi/Psemu1/3450/gm1.3450_g